MLAACARLFLEKGYTNTRMVDILKDADVSASSFQNIFRTKDGVLTAFVEIMFSGQFGAARQMAADAPTPAHVYAVDTALQLARTELNETLRDVQAVAVSEMECDTVFVVGAALNVRTGAVVGTDSNIYLSVQPTQAEKEALYMKSEERTIAIALKACVLLAK